MRCMIPRSPGVPHRCRSCGRLLGIQTGSSLHIKRKDFEGHVVGRVHLRCRCGATTVLATAHESASPSAS
jgi:hypothetical protein